MLSLVVVIQDRLSCCLVKRTVLQGGSGACGMGSVEHLACPPALEPPAHLFLEQVCAPDHQHTASSYAQATWAAMEELVHKGLARCGCRECAWGRHTRGGMPAQLQLPGRHQGSFLLGL